MMRRAGRVRGLRAAAAVLLLGLLTLVGIESYGEMRARIRFASPNES